MPRFLAVLILSTTVFAVIALPASAVDGRSRREVKKRVEAIYSEARWDTRGTVELDINCDGSPDFAVSGRGSGVIHIAVVMGPLDRTSGAFVVDVPLAREGAALCDEDPELLVQSSDYDPAEMLAVSPEGFQRSETCQELAIGRACMKFHIYWNHSASRLGVWN